MFITMTPRHKASIKRHKATPEPYQPALRDESLVVAVGHDGRGLEERRAYALRCALVGTVMIAGILSVNHEMQERPPFDTPVTEVIQ